VQCLGRAEFVIVGWSDSEGSRHGLAAYYEADGRLLYAGSVGTGMSFRTLAMLHDRLKPLAIPTMPLAIAPLASAPLSTRHPQEARNRRAEAGSVPRWLASTRNG
jgi:bifunctional non-homologous end joining protein LigD